VGFAERAISHIGFQWIDFVKPHSLYDGTFHLFGPSFGACKCNLVAKIRAIGNSEQ